MNEIKDIETDEAFGMYDVASDLLIFTKGLFEKVCMSKKEGETSEAPNKEKNEGTDNWALFCFLYYMAKWQKTNQVRAVNSYIMRGLGWTEKRVIRAKRNLINLQLIKVLRICDTEHEYPQYYLKINLVWGNKSLRRFLGSTKSQVGENGDQKGNQTDEIDSIRNRRSNALRLNNKKEKINKKEEPPKAKYLYLFSEEFTKDPEFCDIWLDFENHRKEMKKPLTPTAMKMLMSKILKFGCAETKKQIRRSIEHHWQTLYEEAPFQKGTNSNSAPTEKKPVEKLSAYTQFIFDRLQKVYEKLNVGLALHPNQVPDLIRISKEIRAVWKAFPEIVDDETSWDALKKTHIYHPSARHSVKGAFGHRETFIQRYYEFVLEKFAGMDSLHLNALAVGSKVWAQFIHHEEQRLSLDFETGRRKA